MRFCTLFFCLLLLSNPTLAYDQQKILIMKKISQSIQVDGLIEPAWLQADSAITFFQMQPYFGQPPSRHTVARVLTTEDALYCLIVCFDNQENIQRNTGKLDDFGGDIVSIMLDTFGDKKTAYKFAVSASGVKADSRMLDDARNRDYGWDGVWFSDSKIYDWGYVVEIEIPYRSIQYDETLTSWGLDFDRWIPKLNEDLYWCVYEQNEGQRISKFGRLMFDDFRPSVKGENLEIYPVGITSARYLPSKKYKVDADVGLDIFYNPSPKLTFQLTGNPDFAQIEADPFSFNISRYETYYNERRPFFTQGNEIFMPSGRERNTGFYRPLELLYTRRIGKKLPDGTEVPLYLGTKAFGRVGDWEYGGFLSMTGKTDYMLNGSPANEPQAYFASARVKKHILDNSTIGVLFVGKHSESGDNGVLDIDGAFRTSDWQLSYQIARSFKDGGGDFGGSAGFVMFQEKWINLFRTRIIGENFDIDQVGFVPWRGTSEITALTGPRWYYEDGYVSQILIYGGGILYNEKADGYTDHSAIMGYNMQFRSNWGFELTGIFGQSKDLGTKYHSYEISLSSWFMPSPDFNGNVWGGYSRTYNFNRGYLAYYAWTGADLSFQILKTLQAGTSLSGNFELKPDRSVEDIVLNGRPYFSITPVNDLNIRLYLDVLYFNSTAHVEQTILGFLFSYNFLPKSWIYLAVNESRDRSSEVDAFGAPIPNRLHVADRAAVLKLKYLYYF
ncbi:MAG: DUF5916 domain-containing protein [Bacteroidota bacterium]